MKRGTEKIWSENAEREGFHMQSFQNLIFGLQVLTQLGCIASSFWLIYRVFVTSGFLIAIFAFFCLSVIYKFGVSLMFAAAASVLCFTYNAVGMWLPIAAYVLAVVLLYINLKQDRMRRRVDPYKLGSIHD